MELKLTAEQLEKLIHMGFPSREAFMRVEDLKLNFARVRMLYKKWMLRPGNVLSGPTIFTAADIGMYVCVMAHIGPELMAVTSDMTLHFINKGAPGDLIADTRLLKLGRKLAVMDVAVFSSAAPETMIAHISGSYALPQPKK
ncbi:MAG: PaaI family thioesterase [Pseudomonadota bacterium]